VTERYYTTSTAFFEALAEAGTRHSFANLGSDHPGLIEALAHAKAEGRADELLQLAVCSSAAEATAAAHCGAGRPRVDQGLARFAASPASPLRLEYPSGYRADRFS
jgi:hypothetical protein